MGLFSSYNDEYQELLEHLTQDWEMKPQYARPFLDAYKKDVGKKLARGRRRVEKAMSGNDPTASLAAYAMEGRTGTTRLWHRRMRRT